MGNAGFVRQGGDEFVAAASQVGGYAVFPGGEGGQEEQAAGGDGDGPLGGQAFQHPPGGAENDRGIAAQQDLPMALTEFDPPPLKKDDPPP